jgi:hypothetical protein
VSWSSGRLITDSRYIKVTSPQNNQTVGQYMEHFNEHDGLLHHHYYRHKLGSCLECQGSNCGGITEV